MVGSQDGASQGCTRSIATITSVRARLAVSCSCSARRPAGSSDGSRAMISCASRSSSAGVAPPGPGADARAVAEEVLECALVAVALRLRPADDRLDALVLAEAEDRLAGGEAV